MSSTSSFPIPRLDTSLFLRETPQKLDDEDDFQSAYVDIERISPGGQRDEMSIDTPGYDDDDEDVLNDNNQQPPKIPIREVLDIFQQLKLAFGRRPS